jgi:hypothetical protein
MNVVKIIVQSKDDPKNILNTPEKVHELHEGLTVVFIESATEKGQLGIEFITKAPDINGNTVVTGYAITENNMEALMGGFIGARMRFGRMPADQWEMVRHYVKDKAKRFIETLDTSKRKTIESDVRKFFGV